MSEESLNFIAGQSEMHTDWQEAFVTREGFISRCDQKAILGHIKHPD